MSLNEDIGHKRELYRGLKGTAQSALELRSYQKADLDGRLSTVGVEAGELIGLNERPENWIPGVEVLPRSVFKQRHRGHFSELTRFSEGRVHEVQFVAHQWAAATMFAGTAKGFHIHPPHIPQGWAAEDWFQHLFCKHPHAYDQRLYGKEQWDLMFFVTGNTEMFLVDERAGLPRRRMRFHIDGDDNPGKNNVCVFIPPGVAHALQVEGTKDLVMIYATSTVFNPDFEGRIASDVESVSLIEDWARYMGIDA